MGEWPRKLGGHLIVRDVHPRLAEDRVARYRCIKCGWVMDDLDEGELRREPCEIVPYIRKPPRRGGREPSHSRE